MARPTKYRDDFPQKAEEYLEQSQDEYEEFHKTRGEKSDSYDRLVRVKLPTIEGFSLFLNVHLDSLYEWAKIYPAFSESLEKIKNVQRERLLQNGLSGDYNPMIAKLILSANHGMNEKTESESKVKVEIEAINSEEKKALLSLLNDKGGTN